MANLTDTIVYGDIDIKKQASVKEDLEVLKNMSVAGTLGVTGAITGASGANITGTITATGNITSAGYLWSKSTYLFVGQANSNTAVQILEDPATGTNISKSIEVTTNNPTGTGTSTIKLTTYKPNGTSGTGKATSSGSVTITNGGDVTIPGRLTVNGRITAQSNGGSYVSGMTLTNAVLSIPTQQVSDGSRYDPYFAVKTGSGHVVNIGGINDSVGFYGFNSSRNTNGVDWYATFNASNGLFTSNGGFSGNLSGNATTATYLSSSTYSKGGITKPVYFVNGQPAECSSIPYSFITGTPTTATTSTDGLMSSTDKGYVMPFVMSTHQSSTSSWTGTLSSVSALYDGLTIRYYLGQTPTGSATLNLTLSGSTTTGAINVYYNGSGTRVTTHYPKGSVLTLTYLSAGKNALSNTAGWFCTPQYNSTYNFSGTTFYSGASGSAEHNADNITANGHYYYTSNGPTTAQGATTTDGAIYAQSQSSSWVGQIAQDYRNGRTFFRGRNNGTWTTWLTNIDSGNIGSQSVNYATSAGSASSATTATKSDYPTGFSSRATTATWGNQTGTVLTNWGTSNGGNLAFRDNCPSSGKVSAVIDGLYYQNEGNYACIDTSGGTITGALTVNGGFKANGGLTTTTATATTSVTSPKFMFSSSSYMTYNSSTGAVEIIC